MEKRFPDKWGDHLDVSLADGAVFLTSTVDDTGCTLAFDPHTALHVAEYLLRAARKAVKYGAV